ncbi:hypothetical protein, partial [Tannerella forsythia]|uniref:hypothetical protein n=1 Tax=Tannerella forsythia TaxID=28112 RepID=UPI0016398A64
TVENHGNKPWRGAFFLKHGSTNLNAWSGSVVQAGSSITLTFDYTPTQAGSQSITLYAQENEQGAGERV